MKLSSSFQTAISSRINYDNMGVAEIMVNYSPKIPFSSAKEYYRYVKKTMTQLGIAVYPARFDHARNCIACGEAGSCPGWHTEQEHRKAKTWGKEHLNTIASYDVKPVTTQQLLQMEFAL